MRRRHGATQGGASSPTTAATGPIPAPLRGMVTPGAHAWAAGSAQSRRPLGTSTIIHTGTIYTLAPVKHQPAADKGRQSCGAALAAVSKARGYTRPLQLAAHLQLPCDAHQDCMKAAMTHHARRWGHTHRREGHPVYKFRTPLMHTACMMTSQANKEHWASTCQQQQRQWRQQQGG
jgi:hypothetical protein